MLRCTSDCVDTTHVQHTLSLSALTCMHTTKLGQLCKSVLQSAQKLRIDSSRSSEAHNKINKIWRHKHNATQALTPILPNLHLSHCCTVHYTTRHRHEHLTIISRWQPIALRADLQACTRLNLGLVQSLRVGTMVAEHHPHHQTVCSQLASLV